MDLIYIAFQRAQLEIIKTNIVRFIQSLFNHLSSIPKLSPKKQG
jgi:hypothetical protein